MHAGSTPRDASRCPIIQRNAESGRVGVDQTEPEQIEVHRARDVTGRERFGGPEIDPSNQREATVKSTWVKP